MIKESKYLKFPLRYKVTSHNGIEIHEASEYKPNVFTLVCSIKGCHISIVKLFIQTVNSHKGLLKARKDAREALGEVPTKLIVNEGLGEFEEEIDLYKIFSQLDEAIAQAEE